jgi:hypothetical protein
MASSTLGRSLMPCQLSPLEEISKQRLVHLHHNIDFLVSPFPFTSSGTTVSIFDHRFDLRPFVLLTPPFNSGRDIRSLDGAESFRLFAVTFGLFASSLRTFRSTGTVLLPLDRNLPELPFG